MIAHESKEHEEMTNQLGLSLCPKAEAYMYFKLIGIIK